MPQPYLRKPDEPLRFGVGVLAERPDCALGIAQICATWAEVEHQLARLFVQATSTWIPEAPGVHRATPNADVMSAYETLDSIFARTKMVEAVCARLLDDEHKVALRMHLDRVRKAIGVRNAVAHARWAITERKPDDVLMFTKSAGRFDRYTLADLADADSRLRRLAFELEAFSLSVVASITARTFQPRAVR